MKRVLCLLLTVAVVFAALTGCDDDSAKTSNIHELIWSFTDRAIEMKSGDNKSGYILASVQNRDDFDPDDVVFISDDESVATITYTRTALSVYIYFEIEAVGVGTTSVYAASADGETISEKIGITVTGDAATEAATETDIVTHPQTNAATSPPEAEPIQTNPPATDPPRVEQPEADPPPQVVVDPVTTENPDGYTYVLNTSTKKIHKMSCASVKQIKPENYATTTDYEGAIADGYVQCKKCG